MIVCLKIILKLNNNNFKLYSSGFYIVDFLKKEQY